MSEEMPPISVCVTTKNVEDTIDTCLSSVSDWADEIVVLDSDSQDETIPICKQHGANIYQYEFQGFADLFQSAIDKAHNEWVLILDADEEVSESLRREIFQKLPENGVVAYEIPFKNHMFGGWVHTNQTKSCLAKKETITFKQDYIHPQLSIKDQYESEVEELSNPINHYTYERVSDYIDKFDQYTALEALRHVEGDNTPSYLSFISKGVAMCLYQLTVKRGVLDGYRGVLFALMSFQYEMVTHAKIQDISRLMKEEPDSWKDSWLDEECQR